MFEYPGQPGLPQASELVWSKNSKVVQVPEDSGMQPFNMGLRNVEAHNEEGDWAYPRIGGLQKVFRKISPDSPTLTTLSRNTKDLKVF